VNEERKMILDMLAERKITAEEAAELLRALGVATAGETASGAGAAPDDGYVAGAAAPGRPRTGPTPGKSILEDFLGKLDIDWSSLPLALGGEGYRFDEEHSGEFTSGGRIKLEFTARNGRVEVFGWDKPGWQVVLRKKIRAQSEERARERADEVCRFVSGPDFLQFEELPTGWGTSGVSAEVHVPKDRQYELVAVSSNGRIVVEEIKGTKLLGKTANGKVTVRGAVAQDVSLSTANGGIIFAGSANRLDCGTANGTINCCPVADANMDCRLHTSNGSIKVKLPESRSVGYDIDAHTSHGTIDVEVRDFEISSEERQFGRRTIKGRSRDFAARQTKVIVDARTTNGSIRIVPAVAGEDC